ncbi:polysaccharide export outer membrane protein [Sphingomonas zeae]|jgi:protein involved in polysaccharide export with SLBB domain|nr:polysaccharide biosynthesis/export family protein [Sphingomonas zeae]MBB4048633.1 polysaccharide export outer membrane protein [Sphingomonas zeae]
MPSGVSRTMATRLMTLFLATALPAVASGQEAVPGRMAAAGEAATGLPIYNYVLSGGDRVRVVVFGDPALGGEFTIAGSGLIAMPLIGEVDVRGLTSTQLQDRIVAKLADGYIKDPRVAVEVLSTRPFYILGEVNKPGQYPFANGLTILGAVAQAGGYTYRAKTKQVFIKHAGQNEEVAEPVTATTLVSPGDTIRIKERWF